MIQFEFRRQLMDAVADEGSSGGGTAAGSGQTGTGDAPQFDPAKFRAEILAEFNRTINGAIKNLKVELSKKAETSAAADAPSAPDDTAQPAARDPKVAALERRLADLTAKLEAEQKRREETERAAREKERAAAIRSALSRFQFAKPSGLEAAFRLVESDIRYGEDGALETPDGSSLDEYIAAKIEREYDYLLAPKPAAGAGASPGGRRGTQTIDLNDIKPGMKPEQLAAVKAEIARLLQEGR